ncbi:riboflavin synthase [Candidatus Woesearchaeota archaeon]|nr:riboflavin synthase [Candidatus Woesearchaeota archaeon]
MKVGVADTTFATVDLFAFVEEVFKVSNKSIVIERYTVPGIKDLPVACKILFEKYGCDICLALGMPGDKPIDKQCAHEASLGLQQVQLLCSKHILEVFVHMDESPDADTLFNVVKNRASKHALNALALLEGKDSLRPWAGLGRRQGFADAGPLRRK